MHKTSPYQISEEQYKITDFFECMIDGSYKELFFVDYDKYITRQVWAVRRHYKSGTVLSIGCGTGDIESLLPFPVVCHDIHNAAQILHPQLDFRSSWPEEQFDLVICLGTVLPFVPPNEQDNFIERLISSVKPTGLILLHGLNYNDKANGNFEEYAYSCKIPSHPQIKIL